MPDDDRRGEKPPEWLPLETELGQATDDDKLRWDKTSEWRGLVDWSGNQPPELQRQVRREIRARALGRFAAGVFVVGLVVLLFALAA